MLPLPAFCPSGLFSQTVCPACSQGALLELSECPGGHPADIERVAVVPDDKAVGNIRGVEPLPVDGTPGDTERLGGVVGDRPGGLVPRPVTDHLRELSVLVCDHAPRAELDRPSQRVATGKPQQDPPSTSGIHT